MINTDDSYDAIRDLALQASGAFLYIHTMNEAKPETQKYANELLDELIDRIGEDNTSVLFFNKLKSEMEEQKYLQASRTVVHMMTVLKISWDIAAEEEEFEAKGWA